MVVIKNNKEMPYDSNKIRRAIIQAANQIKLPDFDFIDSLTNEITTKVVMKGKDAVSNSEIENIVMSVLYDKAPDIARKYSDYKIDKERAKKNPTEIEKVLYVNDDIKYENGNKNPNLVHIKNAYLAEIPSKEMLKKLLPKDCWDAHERSIVYFNDSAYSARNLLNCTKGDAWIDVRKTDRKDTSKKMTIEEFFSLFEKSDKECLVNLEDGGYQILARDGWTKIKRLNRRRLDKDELLYQLNTRNGLPLNLTAKHRLPVLRNGREVLLEVKDIKVGDCLLSFDDNKLFTYNNPEKIISINTYHEDCFVYDIETETHWYNINNHFSHNCCLWNLEDMFKGCAINSTYIETPKSFRTACTVASQALTMATSSQFGGITINLLHLAKFVDVSRKKIEAEVEEEIRFMLDNFYDNEKSNFDFKKVKTEMVNKRLQKEIEDGMQTFLYQTNTLCSGTGQAAFLSVGCWLSEDPKYSDDLIMVYKELIKQRLKGMRQEDGTYANPNFPKILYVLDKDTMKGGKYYEITKLSAKCSAQRLVPDYLGLKKHLKLKGVLTFPMGK